MSIDNLKYVLEARGVSYCSPKTGNLHSIDLMVRSGECYCLLGHDRQNKSALLKIFYGRIQEWSGDIFILGTNVREQADPVRWKMGVVPEFDDLESELSVFNNLILAGRYLDMSNKEVSAAAWKCLSLAGLEDEMALRVGLLNSFQRRKLLFSRALISNPEILVVEQYESEADEETKSWLWQAISELKCAKIICTNYHDKVESISDRIAVIHEGRLVATGLPSRLIEKYIGKSIVEIKVEQDEVPYFQARLNEMDFDYQIFDGKISIHLNDFHHSQYLLGKLPPKEHIVRSASLEDVVRRVSQGAP